MTTTTLPAEPANQTFAVWFDANNDPFLTFYREDAHASGKVRWFNADQYDPGDDDEPKSWAQLCELAEGMKGPQLLVPLAELPEVRANRETYAELAKVRAQVADLADKLHKANADNASLTKAGTAWANEVDRLRTASEALVSHIDVIREQHAVLLPRDVGETLLARGAALAALLPNTQGPRPGQFCAKHFSWLCQAGQGRCQAEKAGVA